MFPRNIADWVWSVSYTHLDVYKRQDIVGARVVKILEVGVIVEWEDGLTGLLHINEMTQDHNKKPGKVL